MRDNGRTITLALSGRKGAGKDTIARLLHEGYGFRRIAFADHLKDQCAEEFSVPRAEFDDTSLDPATGKAVKERHRTLLQTVGMRERAKDPLIWVRRSGLLEATGRVVVTDCRFVNEVEAVESRGGERWWVSNPEAEQDGDTHASERTLTARGAAVVIRNQHGHGIHAANTAMFRLADFWRIGPNDATVIDAWVREYTVARWPSPIPPLAAIVPPCILPAALAAPLP